MKKIKFGFGIFIFAFLIYGILLIIQKHSILNENIFINGIVLGLFGFDFSRELLHLMNNDLELSVVYLKLRAGSCKQIYVTPFTKVCPRTNYSNSN